MRTPFFVGSCAIALAAAASALLAAPGQTAQPGQMTQARVFVLNRGRTEAIPINLQESSLEAPLRVRVVNAQSVPGRDEPVAVRVVAPPPVWQYQTVTVAAGENMATALSPHGAAGWETTGVAIASPAGTMVLMKRMREPTVARP